MILAAYMGRVLIRFVALITLLIYLISFLDIISGLALRETNDAGIPLTGLRKLLITFGQASLQSLDFMPIIFMIAAILTLVTLGRRAELHIIRGTGVYSGRILATLAVLSAGFMILITLILRPLAYEASLWADRQLSLKSSEAYVQPGPTYVAWFSANNGDVLGRLEGYNPETKRAAKLHISNRQSPDLAEAFVLAYDVGIDQQRLTFANQNGADDAESIEVQLDTPPRILPQNRVNFDLPLIHLFGWKPNEDRWSLNGRQMSYLVQRALAEPILTAAMVLLAGTLCVEIGTRQPLTRLIFSALGYLIATYSFYVVADAFGLNGKLSPFLAAWGIPLALLFFGLAQLALRDVSWHFAIRKSILNL